MTNNVRVKYGDMLDYIAMKKKSSVVELTSVFYLSESTVRRILRELEKEGCIERYHGGAAIKEGILPDASSGYILNNRYSSKVGNRTGLMTRHKAAIASKAASYVRDGMTIIMLGGTTVHAMCRYLTGRRLTVITNSIPVANDMIKEPNCKVILLGGIVNPQELEIRGSLTTACLERLRADQVFAGAVSIHEHHGLMTDDPEAVDTYRVCMKAADRSFLLADSTKFRPGGAAVVAGLDEFNDIITDEAAQAEVLKCIVRNSNCTAQLHMVQC